MSPGAVPPAGDAGGLFERVEAVLALKSPAHKVTATQQLLEQWRQGRIVAAEDAGPATLERPGCPDAPLLVHPRALPRRRTGSAEGRAAMLHAIAHIEFNAIHLALDACYRFRGLPRAFYDDWLSVAAEESIHFSLLASALERRGWRYGSFAAHDGLWEMADKTRHDVLARMALVPRTLEARGLDASPEIRARFAALGDEEAVAILDRILADEVGHVAIGNRWYAWLCAQRSLDPQHTFAALSAAFDAPRPHLPLNRAARLQAGFTAHELDLIEQRARSHAPRATPVPCATSRTPRAAAGHPPPAEHVPGDPVAPAEQRGAGAAACLETGTVEAPTAKMP